MLMVFREDGKEREISELLKLMNEINQLQARQQPLGAATSNLMAGSSKLGCLTGLHAT
jgi:hypothetical protein